MEERVGGTKWKGEMLHLKHILKIKIKGVHRDEYFTVQSCVLSAKNNFKFIH